MEIITKTFNNRELAIITWILIALIGLIFLKPFREFIKTALYTFSRPNFVTIYLLMFLYLFLVIEGLIKIKFWNIYLIKDTIFWYISVGVVLALRGISKNVSFFKKTLVESLKITLLIEFFINIHVFNYFLEFIILPTMTFLILMQDFTKEEVKHKQVNTFLNNLIGIIGFTLFFIALYKTYQNYRQDFSFHNLQSLLLPSILTIVFIPFSYLVALYSAYEVLFTKFSNIKKEKISRNKIRYEVVKIARLNLTTVNKLNSRINLFEFFETDDIRKYLKNLIKTSC